MEQKRLIISLLATRLVPYVGGHSMKRQVSTRCTYSVYRNLKSRLPLTTPQRSAHAVRAAGKPVIKPLETLQKYTTAPLLSQEDLVFDPTTEEIREAQDLFLPNPNHRIDFLKSAVFTEQLPDYDLPEVAFIGRSNVGKSSLIKILLSGVKDLDVRISQNPGHTKTLNFFQLGDKLSIVDMPGYGFRMPDHYVESVETFLRSRQKLCRTFFLLDADTGVGKADIIGLSMLEEFQIPYVMTFVLVDGKVGVTVQDITKLNVVKDMGIRHCVVMTKIDKAKPSRLIKNFMSVVRHRNETTYCFSQPFLVSSINGDGIALLQAFIAYVSGNFKPKGL